MFSLFEANTVLLGESMSYTGAMVEFVQEYVLVISIRQYKLFLSTFQVVRIQRLKMVVWQIHPNRLGWLKNLANHLIVYLRKPPSLAEACSQHRSIFATIDHFG